jgi:hypothetical protein
MQLIPAMPSAETVFACLLKDAMMATPTQVMDAQLPAQLKLASSALIPFPTQALAGNACLTVRCVAVTPPALTAAWDTHTIALKLPVPLTARPLPNA